MTSLKDLKSDARILEQKYKRILRDPRIFSTGIFGDNSDYSNRYDMSGNNKASVRGNLFNIPSGKTYTISQITAKIYNAGNGDWRYGIYKIVNGIPSAELIAYTEEKTNVVYGSLVTANIIWPSSSVSLEGGNYLLVVICGHTIGIYRGSKSGQIVRTGTFDSYTDGFSDPYGSGGTDDMNYSLTIYAEYSAVEGETD